ncbi:ornithine cyclodeaminase family protein [Aurantimonas endophytica]|uniref:Ornithine cyclodeaminase n=1 Tax=Aurantimonas endophytica TaxID=1522175 RepID=A0A7W6H9V7_9HYPH|nr:ornithine cyclodeaminase [Aurantimonas endophytica]MBB4001281.1 ornithine cyclodeaminase [Aurantimonas endophytica]MCO6403075.1 ornithine cyclodeaminase [Aurantimonas endophytica]
MRFISFPDADRLLTWTMVADAIEAGHRLPAPEIGDMLLSSDGRSLLNRAAWVSGLGIALKSVTVYPDNPRRDPPLPTVQGSVLVFDEASGAPVALVDGILVTKWKTAGDSVLGARLLARPDSRKLLICGAGTLARSLVEAYREVFPGLEEIRIWNRTPEKAAQLAAEWQAQGIAVRAVTDLAATVAESDIVSTATMAVAPFLQGDWLRPGTHVDLIGAYRPDMREADDAVLARGELFVDSRRTTIGHIGEIEIPLQQGVIDASDIRGDLAELVSGAVGRTGPEAITVFKNGGGAHLDLMVADLIRRTVAAKG